MKILYYDLETTGTNHWEHGIHQLSGYVEIDGALKDSFDLKVQPKEGCRIEMQALALQNLTLDIVNAYPKMSEVFNHFRTLLKKHVDNYNKSDKFFLCGYNNASFDNQFFRQWFQDNGDKYFGSYFWSNSIDVMVLATEKLKSMRKTMANFKLHTVAEILGIPVDQNKLHDALYDIELTIGIYKKITAKE